MDVALQMMQQHQQLRELLSAMLDRTYPAAQALEALQHAQQRGVLKVQVCFGGDETLEGSPAAVT